MFERSGEKVKKVGTAIFYIMVVIAIIVFVVGIIGAMFTRYGGFTIFISSLLSAGLIILGAWIYSLFLVAFGDLVNSNEKIVELLEGIVKNNLSESSQNSSSFSNNNLELKKYVVVIDSGEQFTINVKKESTWDDIVDVYNKIYGKGTVNYVIDENGTQVYKGGYLG